MKWDQCKFTHYVFARQVKIVSRELVRFFFKIIWSEIIISEGQWLGRSQWVTACPSPRWDHAWVHCTTRSQGRFVSVWMLVNIWTMWWCAGDKEINTERVLQGQDPGLGDYCIPGKLQSAPWVGEWVEHNCPRAEMGKQVRPVVLSELMWACLTLFIHAASSVHVYVVYSCALYWEKLLSLVTAWVWGRDGTASPPLAARCKNTISCFWIITYSLAWH